jgi:hypothetical protein
VSGERKISFGLEVPNGDAGGQMDEEGSGPERNLEMSMVMVVRMAMAVVRAWIPECVGTVDAAVIGWWLGTGRVQMVVCRAVVG